MERRLSVFVDDGVSCVGPPLEPNDDIGLSREDIRHLSFSLVAPVGADNRSDHAILLSDALRRKNLLFYFTTRTREIQDRSAFFSTQFVHICNKLSS